jgi:carbonic anhydrase
LYYLNSIFLCNYSYAMEGHFVHYKTSYGSLANAANQPDGLAVVALMFKVS